MANTVNLEFAGDADKLAKEAKRAEQSVTGVGDSATSASQDLERAANGSAGLTDRMAKLGEITTGAMDAFDGAAGTMQALVDIQDSARATQQRLARALNDVAQAQEDYNQALLDGKQAEQDGTQAAIDARQARLDARAAQLDYNTAVAEHGKNSIEAEQASIDLTQANADLKQATLDSEQATRDASQSLIDAKGAQLDLNDAQREANPPDMQKWADQINLYAPLLNGLVGIFALVTAAQWAWNAATLASPVTWIVLGIAALIAIIVLLVKNWDWVKAKGAAAWGWIKEKAQDFWGWIKSLPGKLKDSFSSVGDFLSKPFRTAFNIISRAWNATVGQLSWTIPGWVPFWGGNSIVAPKLPTFHQGGKVPGAPGSEVLAMLQAGETVTSTAGSVGGREEWIRIDLGELGEALLPPIARALGRRGGGVSALGIKVINGAVRA